MTLPTASTDHDLALNLAAIRVAHAAEAAADGASFARAFAEYQPMQPGAGTAEFAANMVSGFLAANHDRFLAYIRDELAELHNKHPRLVDYYTAAQALADNAAPDAGDVAPVQIGTALFD